MNISNRLVGGIFGALVLCAPMVAEAITLPSVQEYYPESLGSSPLQGDALRARIHSILDDFHVSEPGKRDTIFEACPPNLKPSQTCFKRQTITYEEARQYLFGDERFHLKVNAQGDYVVRDVYCRKEFGSHSQYPATVGPGLVPSNTALNVEHTWPQSEFTQAPKGFMKTDLHHLFPADSKANSTRGNHPFGEVDSAPGLPGQSDCDASRIGGARAVPELAGVSSGGDHTYFQPPPEHRGNVARAMFYFAVRYNLKIDAVQEYFLRKWNAEDPVDAAERSRNEAVYSIQQLRNPFVDYPQLVDRIRDF